MNLIPHHILQVGDLKFDPSHGCKKQCYTGLSTERNSKDSSSITQLQLLLFTYFPKSQQTKSKVPTFLGKSCWTARLAIPIQIPLIFLDLNCHQILYLSASNLKLALSISGIHKTPTMSFDP